MKLYRRGPLYFVCRDLDHGYCFDSLTGTFTSDVDPRQFLGKDARYWLPVYEDQPIPDALRARLILPLLKPE